MAKIVEVTNPVTGQPTQVDQLDHTAQQIDDAVGRALPGGYYDKWVSQLPGQNLLDNSVFLPGCLVDQRQGRVVKPNTTYYSDNQLTTSAGTTSAYVTAYRYATGTASGVNYASFKLTDTDDAPTYYAAPANVVRGYTGVGVFTVDRWKNSSGDTSILVTDSGLTMVGGTAFLTQKIEDSLLSELDGKIITISSLWTDNVLQTFTWVLNKSQFKKGDNSLYVYVPNDGFFVSRPIGESQKTVKAAKLELGSQQTLAHQDENGKWVLNEIPDYGEQLARCKRSKQYIGVGIIGVWQDETRLFLSGQFPVQMRAIPTVTLKSKSVTVHTLGIGDATTDNATLGIYRLMENGIDYLRIEGFSGGATGRVVVLSDNYLELKAEL